MKILYYILLFFILSCEQAEKSISYNVEFQNYENCDKKHFLDSISTTLKKYKNDSLKSKMLFKIAKEYSYLGNNKLSLKYSKLALIDAKYRQDSISIGRALYYEGDCFLDYHKDSAYYYYKESEKIFRKLNNKDKLALVLYNKAYLLFYEGNYVESEIEVIKALNCLKSSEKIITKYRCYSLQGSNHLELGEYDKAEEYFI